MKSEMERFFINHSSGRLVGDYSVLGIGLRQFDDLNTDRALERERDLYKQMKSEMRDFYLSRLREIGKCLLLYLV